jgi:hypothetical protein
MPGKLSIARLLAALSFLVPGVAVSQDANQNRTLIVNGQPGEVPVIQVKGRSFVDLEALTRVTNGSLSFSGNWIVLTLSGAPAPTTATATPAPAPAPASNPGFSKVFLRAGIEEMATMREWHTALATTIQNGYPLGADWLAPYRAEAVRNLRLASVAVSTDSDRGAYQLLSTEFQNMEKLTDKYNATRASLDYIEKDALDTDDLNQRIVSCGHSLASMVASGQFVDDGSCR